MGWQPIETAPKDGTVIRATHEHYHGRFPFPCKVRFDGNEWVLEPPLGTLGAVQHTNDPTHWMPLPEPPRQ